MSTRSSSPRPIGAVLRELIDRLGIGTRLQEARARDAWAELAGPAIAGVTEAVWMRAGKMFVKIASPAWRHELHLQREEWARRINEHVGAPVVKEIVFR